MSTWMHHMTRRRIAVMVACIGSLAWQQHKLRQQGQGMKSFLGYVTAQAMPQSVRRCMLPLDPPHGLMAGRGPGISKALHAASWLLS